MATLQVASIPDFINSTLPELGRLKFTDLMSDYRNTIMLKRIMKKKKATFQSGSSVDFGVMTGVNSSARHVGIGETDVIDIPTLTTRGTVPWRFCTWNYAYDERVVNLNRDPARIMEIVKEQRMGALGAGIILFERAGWRFPDSTNTKDPYGVPYWVVKSNTAATSANNDGFNGTAQSGYTLVGGINPTTNTRWRNYATQYTALTKDDFVRKARRMREYIDFMPLVDEIPTYNTGDDYGQYTNYTVKSALQEILETQNENLGNDVASFEGKNTVLLAGVAVTAVQELDLDTTDPFYCLNWGVFGAVGNSGMWMKETFIPNKADQHNISVHHTDCCFNYICRDRRRQGVLATNTTTSY